MDYNDYLLGPEWEEISNGIKKRDNYKCIRCGSPKSLQVHHLTYYGPGRTYRTVDANYLVTLCKSCHTAVHDEMRRKGKQKYLCEYLYMCLRDVCDTPWGICPDCNGWGYLQKTHRPCPTCGGERYIPQSVAAGYETMEEYNKSNNDFLSQTDQI